MRAISIIRSPNEKGFPKIAGLCPRFLGKRRNSTAALADCLSANRCNAGAVSTSAEGKTPSRKSGGCPSKSRHSAAKRAPENRSVRKHCEIFGKRRNNAAEHAGWYLPSRCKAGVVSTSAAERKTNAEPRFAAANIRLSLKSQKKVLSLLKLFS